MSQRHAVKVGHGMLSIQVEVTPSPGSTFALGSGGEPCGVIHPEHKRELMA
ncbi:MAG: hypothetical protein M1119_10365 [Firmicutes bacterium]|nr:hypothetical protein [Bacillota bacterium]